MSDELRNGAATSVADKMQGIVLYATEVASPNAGAATSVVDVQQRECVRKELGEGSGYGL